MISKPKTKGKNQARADPPVPPSIMLVPSIPIVFRYLKTNATAATVSSTDFGKLIVQASSATAAVAIYEACRLTKIQAWSPPTAMTSATGFVIPSAIITQQSSWIAGFGSERKSQGFSSATRCGYAKLKLKPPTNDWAEPAGTAGINMFKIEGPIGTVVDVHMVLRLYAKGTTGTSVAGAGATAGKLYGNFLDSATGYLTNQNLENNGILWA